MSSLQIRNVPPVLLKKVRLIAAQEHRSINAQVLVLLSEAVAEKRTPAPVPELLKKAAEIRRAAKRAKNIRGSLELIHRARAERTR
jgi:plasmid stability protein